MIVQWFVAAPTNALVTVVRILWKHRFFSGSLISNTSKLVALCLTSVCFLSNSPKKEHRQLYQRIGVSWGKVLRDMKVIPQIHLMKVIQFFFFKISKMQNNKTAQARVKTHGNKNYITFSKCITPFTTILCIRENLLKLN